MKKIKMFIPNDKTLHMVVKNILTTVMRGICVMEQLSIIKKAYSK